MLLFKVIYTAEWFHSGMVTRLLLLTNCKKVHLCTTQDITSCTIVRKHTNGQLNVSMKSQKYFNWHEVSPRICSSLEYRSTWHRNELHMMHHPLIVYKSSYRSQWLFTLNEHLSIDLSQDMVHLVSGNVEEYHFIDDDKNRASISNEWQQSERVKYR
jgi:hypothetical protein